MFSKITDWLFEQPAWIGLPIFILLSSIPATAVVAIITLAIHGVWQPLFAVFLFWLISVLVYYVRKNKWPK